MSAQDFLVELGCEELPPKSLRMLAESFLAGIEDGLKKADIAYTSALWHAAPRRLAVIVDGLASQQPDRVIGVDGPPVKAAFDANGNPTAAALGFAKKNGVDINVIDRSGEKLRYVKEVKGSQTTSLLPGIVQASLDALPIAKRMRWGASRMEFVRPVQWLLMLYGEQTIDAEVLGKKAGNQSQGHRFHRPQAITISAPAQYVQALQNAHVQVDFIARRNAIQQRVQQLAAEQGGSALMPEALLDEVTALVEWPIPLVCSFEERFLAVPQEALISTMQDNQKYFCLIDAKGKLMNHFIIVANIESTKPAFIIEGNQKVVRPRLTDAEFFYNTDRKLPLAQHNERNRSIVFQNELGTVFEKTQRMEQLAAFIAGKIGGNVSWAERAALLAKADLCTQMVGEFPELQGIMGEYYARHDNETEEVAIALREQYLPRYAGDELPQTRTGLAVALADKLDTLAGLFGIHQPPTGSKDPFALRRASLGVLRMLIESRLPLALDELAQAAVRSYNGKLPAANAADALLEFFFARYRAMYEEQGIAAEVIAAVLTVKPMVPADFAARVNGVAAFVALPEAAALAAAHKRVSNILAKEGAAAAAAVNASLLSDNAEKALYDAITALTPVVQPLFDQGNYSAALSQLAALKAPVDAFFEQVMVMAEDNAVRGNRLALLQQLRALFMRAADIAQLAI